MYGIVGGAIVTDANAQVPVVGPSTSTSSTTPAAKKTFYESGSGNSGRSSAQELGSITPHIREVYE